MPQTTVMRLASKAPRVGVRFGFADGGRTFAGTVVRVSALRKAKQHVAVTVELTESDHRRLVLGGHAQQQKRGLDRRPPDNY